ncbi:MAG: hypothetical protein ABI462_02660 [Ignavibacteria bacterium]
MVKKIFTISAILFFISSSLFAQSSSKKDRYNYRMFSSKPSIELSYGLSDIKINSNSYGLANAGLAELKLGFTNQYSSSYGKNILNYHNKFLFLSYASSDSYAKSNISGLENNLWRFGFGNKEGYGVKLGSVSIMPYNSNSFAWSEFDYSKGIATDPATDYSTLDNFDNTFRFGSTTEAGINLQLAPGFSIQPKYEIADIYPRHLFGKQFMSTIIEWGGLYLIDGFTKQILKNTPVAGAFVNFILKNAYEYGFYQLRKNEMNWPFTSTAPLRYSTFKLGMAFTF